MAEKEVNLMDPRMIAILKGANKIMKKVDTGDYEKGHVNPEALIAETHGTLISEQEARAQGIVKPIKRNNNESTDIDDLDDEAYAARVRSSNLPSPIQEAMIKKRIETVKTDFTNVRALIEDDGEKTFRPSTPKDVKKQPIITKSTINENRNTSNGNEMITIGKNELKGMIKDTLIDYLSGEYAKTLTETVIKQTINTLIKEGKLTVKKKI